MDWSIVLVCVCAAYILIGSVVCAIAKAAPPPDASDPQRTPSALKGIAGFFEASMTPVAITVLIAFALLSGRVVSSPSSSSAQMSVAQDTLNLFAEK